MFIRGFRLLMCQPEKMQYCQLLLILRDIPFLSQFSNITTQIIPVGDEWKKVAVFKVEDGNYVFYRFEKDRFWEGEIFSALRGLGLQGENQSLKLTNSSDDLTSAMYEAIGWLSKNNSYLTEHGISISQERLDHTYFTGTQRLEMQVSHSSDWFDVHATVTFGRFSFPFIRLRKNILGQIREFKLPDGEIAILPLEWFARYKNIFSFGKVGEQSIRLQNYHFMLINEVASEPELSSNEILKNLTGQVILPQEIPNGLCAELRNYQHDGYNWMHHLFANRLGGCLADDMGLGKTIQALTLLLKLKRNETIYPQFNHQKSGQLSLFTSDDIESDPLQPSTPYCITRLSGA